MTIDHNKMPKEELDKLINFWITAIKEAQMETTENIYKNIPKPIVEEMEGIILLMTLMKGDVGGRAGLCISLNTAYKAGYNKAMELNSKVDIEKEVPIGINSGETKGT